MSLSSENRFRSNSFTQIEDAIKKTPPYNTIKSKKSAWEQFSKFLVERKYELEEDTSPEDLAKVLEDYGYKYEKEKGKLVKGKWSNLRDSWIKHMKKRLQPDCKLTRNYTYHDQMLFLTNVYKFEVNDNFFEKDESIFDTIYIKEENFSGDEDNSKANVVVYYPEAEITSSTSNKRNFEEVDETSSEEGMKLEGENRHLSFFKAILPSLNDFSENQIIEFQIAVLEQIRSIKQKQ